jgi:hypothetical protein
MHRASLVVVVVVVVVVGCGSRQHQANAQANAELQAFQCRDRFATYTATHPTGGELGIQLDCSERGPRIQRWRVTTDGTRNEDARSMTPDELDGVWSSIDAIGWQNLKDCSDGGGDNDAIFQFHVGDDHAQSSFACQATPQPFPYHTIVNALDRASLRGHKQLGDEPAKDLPR